jgi:hypothetical protein
MDLLRLRATPPTEPAVELLLYFYYNASQKVAATSASGRIYRDARLPLRGIHSAAIKILLHWATSDEIKIEATNLCTTIDGINNIILTCHIICTLYTT